MNRNRIFLFAGLGVLISCISILTAKKIRKGGKSKWINRAEEFTGAPKMTGFGGSTK